MFDCSGWLLGIRLVDLSTSDSLLGCGVRTRTKCSWDRRMSKGQGQTRTWVNDSFTASALQLSCQSVWHSGGGGLRGLRSSCEESLKVCPHRNVFVLKWIFWYFPSLHLHSSVNGVFWKCCRTHLVWRARGCSAVWMDEGGDLSRMT